MADLNDIEGLICRAQAVEVSDPHKAHARYEVAERELDNLLLISFGVSRDVLLRKPESGLSQRFLPYHREIMAGYHRLEEMKTSAQASSL